MIWTIGHSTKTLEQFLAVLKAHGIGRLIDIRTVPRSRTNPQFNRDSFPEALAAHGIAYEHWPELGGLRHPHPDSINTAWRNANFRGYADYMQTPEFAAALDRLIQASTEERVAIMCAEAVPWRCHRNLVADAVLARGIEARHIMNAERADAHKPIRFGVVKDGHVTYPGDEQPSGAAGEMPPAR